MCLYYSEKATDNFWNTKSRKGKTWCWAYKVYEINDWGNLVPMFAGCFGHKNAVKPGWVKSDRSSRKPFTDQNDYNCGEIHKGIHVILESKAIKSYTEENSSPTVVVRVKCFKKDFVASSDPFQTARYDNPKNTGEAVFMKVFLPKSEYDRVTKK